MGHFYYVRHGQTTWNAKCLVCGRTDADLTELGHKQAIMTGEKILAEGIKADEILHSPLKRARETAAHISEITGIPMREAPEIIEQDFGKWEDQCKDTEEFRNAKMTFADSFGGTESYFRLAQRIYNFLDWLKEASEEKTYIVVAHNGLARVINSYFHDMSNEEFADFGLSNCEVARFDF